jgi:hypothetical protein
VTARRACFPLNSICFVFLFKRTESGCAANSFNLGVRVLQKKDSVGAYPSGWPRLKPQDHAT